MEIFKKIDGFEDYQVSNQGNVKSLKHNKEKILNPGVNGRGYFVVILSKSKKLFGRAVHQLMAIAFLDHKPNGNRMIVDHKDHNKLNNKLDNLQLITNRENCSKDQFRKNPSSMYTGVSWLNQRNKWRATIIIEGKQKYLGVFKNELDAANVYQNALNNLKVAQI